MEIHGLQKLTLLDYPGKVACTVFLGGCNFRCPFCHNGELLEPCAPETDEAGLLAFLDRRRGLLDGVCITGGEPLLRRELAPLLEKIRALGFAVKLDTNGSFPRRLRELVEAGLVDYVAMDIKNSPERYGETAGIPALDLTPIRQSVEFLLTGTVAYEFRTTVVVGLHTDASFHGIGSWIRGAERYFLQCFVDRDTVLQPGLSAPTAQEMARYVAIARAYVPNTHIRGQ